MCLYLSLFFFSMTAYADLYERLNMEEAFKNRIEKALQINDKSAQVTLKMQFKKLETNQNLPGTHQNSNLEFYPDKIETADISKVDIKYFSEKENIDRTQKEIIFSLLPIEKNKIKITFKNLIVKPVPDQSIKIQDISKLTSDSIDYLVKMLILALASATSFFALTYFLTQSKNRKSLKNELSELSQGLSNTHFSSTKAIDSKSENEKPAVKSKNNFFENSNFKLERYPLESVGALLSDFYWCEMDCEAHGLWLNISNKQKSELINKYSFIFGYIQYFTKLEIKQTNYIEHSYYIRPSNLDYISLEDLLRYIDKNGFIWNQIGPVRQKALNLPINKKIEILNSTQQVSLKPKDLIITTELSPSKIRKLPNDFEFGNITFEDEIYLFSNPHSISFEQKKSIPTLTWLALCESSEITDALEKLDAQFLANGWIAAPEILEKLENCIPDAKKVLIYSYIKTMKQDKLSVEFQTLFKLGLNLQKKYDEQFNKAS